jgi:hypothetical protein
MMTNNSCLRHLDPVCGPEAGETACELQVLTISVSRIWTWFLQ